MQITMAHGSGGAATSELIEEIFLEAFGTQNVGALEDAAVVVVPSGRENQTTLGDSHPAQEIESSPRLAITTDSFVVTPLEFPGGDIGRLAVCGTVNDLLMRGAIPKYLTCGFILQEGLDSDQLKRIVHSMAETAKEAGVEIVTGDTKVVEGNGGLMINTTGIGFVPDGVDISAKNIQPGDAVIVSGNLGDHHATILGSRMNIQNEIRSDNAPLNEMVMALLQNHITVHTLRDVTRGGLATVLKELAISSGVAITIREEDIPVARAARDFCGLLGLDPLYMGNEGKLVCFVPEEEAAQALSLIQSSKYGQNARIVGTVHAPTSDEKTPTHRQETTISKQFTPISEAKAGEVLVETSIGGLRSLDVLQGEGLPRIC